MELTEIGLITLISLVITALSYFLRIMLKSRCNMSCCFGLFKLDRKISEEIDLEKIRIEHNIPDEKDSINNNINNILSNIKK